MANNEVTTGEILDFLKEHMMTREESMSLFATKSELLQTKSEILNAVDRFAKLHEILDQEFITLRSRYERLEGRVDMIEQRLGLAT